MAESIIVRAPNWVGDAVMSLPFFASLRLNAPEATVTCLCRSHLVPLFARANGIDHVIALDETDSRHGLKFAVRNARRLRSGKFRVGFCLPPSFGSALMLWLARVPRRVGHAVDGRGLLLTDSAPYGRQGQRSHRTEGYLSLLDLAWPGAERDRTLQFEPGESAGHAVSDLWRRHRIAPIPLLALGPGAAQPNKLWPTARFAEVARRWLDGGDAGVIMVGASSERSLGDDITRSLPPDRSWNLAGAGDLEVAAHIIRRCDVFVGNDSGLSHLAAAVGTPTVVISGPGDPNEVAPFSPMAVTVKRALFCSPCYRNTCWRRDRPLECQDLVTVEEVWEQVSRMRRTYARRNV